MAPTYINFIYNYKLRSNNYKNMHRYINEDNNKLKRLKKICIYYL